MFVALKPLRRERKATADQVIARLRRKLAQVPGATPVPAAGAGPAHRRPRQRSAQYQYTLQGDDLAELHDVGAADARRRCARCPSCATSNTRPAGHGACRPRWSIDRDTAARLGITPQLIDDTLYDAFGQRQVSTIYTPLNQYHVVHGGGARVLAAPGRAAAHLRAVAPSGAQVPLAAFARFEPRQHAARRSTTRASSRRSTLSFNLPPGVVARATRSPRSTGAERQIGLPGDASAAASRARPRPSRPRSPTSRCLILAALVDGLHRARHALRELHPPDHDPLDAALGRASARCSRCCSSGPSSASSR